MSFATASVDLQWRSALDTCINDFFFNSKRLLYMYGIYPIPPPHYHDRHSLFIPANHFFTILLKITALTQKDAMAEKKKHFVISWLCKLADCTGIFTSLALWFKLLVQRLVFRSRTKDLGKNNIEHGCFQKRCQNHGRISSVGTACDCRAGGRGFDSWGRTNTRGLKITEKWRYFLCTASG